MLRNPNSLGSANLRPTAVRHWTGTVDDDLSVVYHPFLTNYCYIRKRTGYGEYTRYGKIYHSETFTEW